MGVDHRRVDVLMTKNLLDRADVVTRFEEMCGEGLSLLGSPAVMTGAERVPQLIEQLSPRWGRSTGPFEETAADAPSRRFRVLRFVFTVRRLAYAMFQFDASVADEAQS